MLAARRESVATPPRRTARRESVAARPPAKRDDVRVPKLPKRDDDAERRRTADAALGRDTPPDRILGLRDPSESVPRSARDAVTWPVRVAAAWSWRLALIAAICYLAVSALMRVSLVLFAFIIALFLTAVLQPLERHLRRWLPRPRSLPSLLALLCGVAVLGAIGYFVGWQISTHTNELGNDLSDVVTRLKHWLETGPLHIKSSDLDDLTSKITDNIKSHQSLLINGAITTVRTAIDVITSFLLILLVTFYLLRDGPKIWQWVVRLFPRAAHARLDHAGQAGWRTFGGYMRGQLTIALFHGISVTIVLTVLRIPLAAALGVLIFLGSFIPLVGLIVTGALAVAVSLLAHGWLSAVVVAGAIIVLVQAEAHLLQPFIMSRSVHIHPLAVVLSVVAGTTLGGIAGALIAVPLVAFINTTVRALRDEPATRSEEPEMTPSEPAGDPAGEPPARPGGLCAAGPESAPTPAPAPAPVDDERADHA